MAEERPKKRRKVCRHTPEIELPIPSSSPAPPGTMPDTPHRARLLDLDNKFRGKVPKKDIFRASNIASEATGYRILRSRSARRPDGAKNRGAKRKVPPHMADAIETVEDSSFLWGTAPHLHVARSLGVKDASERTIQRSMADHGVKTYVAAQAKLLSQANMDERVAYAEPRRHWPKEVWHTYRFSDESHFGLGSQRRQRVHRRRGTENREAPNKIQYRTKRAVKTLHVFAEIGHWYKGKLLFYTGSGKKGALIQADYIDILENWILPSWEGHLTLLEDNDGPHGTRGKGDNPVKRRKRELGIQTQANPRNSPDLNPIEKIWRTIKQRIKNLGRSIRSMEELRSVIEQEWERVTLEEINEWIDEMPRLMNEVCKRGGRPIV
jgi:hypothetical protein